MGSLSTLSVGNLEFSDSGNYSCIATDRQSGQSGEKTGILTVKGIFSFLRGTIYLVCRTLLGDKIARLSYCQARGKRSCSCFSKFYYMAGSSLLASWVLSFFLWLFYQYMSIHNSLRYQGFVFFNSQELEHRIFLVHQKRRCFIVL